MALTTAVQAKNSLLKRHGYSPEQAVFGRALQWGGTGCSDDGDLRLSSLDYEGHVLQAARWRVCAAQAFHDRSVQEKVRRAMTRAPTGAASQEVLLPGTVVYFWEPAVGRGRLRPDPGRWRGPATVLHQEGDNKYFVSWRGRCLLVAREQCRSASAEEAAAAQWIAKETEITGKRLQEPEEQRYQDLRGHPGPLLPSAIAPPPTREGRCRRSGRAWSR